MVQGFSTYITVAHNSGICTKNCYNFIMEFWYVYVLRSQKDRKKYIGRTNDLNRRLAEHQQGKNISTAKRRPLELLYFEGHRSLDDAIRREKYFKTTKGKVTLGQIIRISLSEI